MASLEEFALRRLDRGQYVALDNAAPLVRSTISIAFSHDGRYFASTHGDHVVRVFRYPSAEQIAILSGHSRTPWTVRFHPKDSNIVASGCLSNECRVWDVARSTCIRRHIFEASISCVSFHPSGDLLAIASGRTLSFWEYLEETGTDSYPTATEIDGVDGPGLPREIFKSDSSIHMVDFHPSGDMLMTGEKNDLNSSFLTFAGAQFTLKIVIYRFDGRMDKHTAEVLHTIPRAVAYNEAGVHFSPCGTMLAACVPDQGAVDTFHLETISLVEDSTTTMGAVLCNLPLDKGHVMALTNLRFSPASKHLLAGFSFHRNNPVLQELAVRYNAAKAESGNDGCEIVTQPPQVCVVTIYRIGETLQKVRDIYADADMREGQIGGVEDGINVAVFAPAKGIADGVVYGTQTGRIRIFRPVGGPAVETGERYGGPA